MNEFIKKLIGRLEEETYDMEICEEQFDMNSPYFMDVEYKMVKFDDVKEIVDQLAQEYEREHIVDLCNQFCDKADEILRKKTNAMRIRAMNDEELAEFLSETELHGSQGNYEDYLKWLQSEAE